MEGLAARGHECRAVAPATGRQGLQTAAELLDELTNRRIAFVDSSAATVFEYNKVRVCAVKHPARLHTHAVEEMDRFEPAVVIVSSCTQLEPFLGHRDTRIIYVAHSPWELPFGPGHALNNPSGAELIRRADGIIAVSKDLQQRIRAGCGREAAMLHFPMYGNGPFPHLGSFDKGLVTIVNPCAYKGISVFEKMARRVPHVRFAAVPSWGTTTADLGLLDQLPNVTMIPACDDIEWILRQTRILLVPSLWPEGFGLIAVEAMAYGVPVIASDSGGLPEAKLGVDYVVPIRPIEHYEPACDERGLAVPIVPEQEIDPWTDALQRLTSDRSHYQELSCKSREAALHFISSLSIEPFESYFEAVVRGGDGFAVRPCSCYSRRPPARSAAVAAAARLSPARRALLAARLTKTRSRMSARSPLLPLPRTPGHNSFPLSFAQERLWFVEQLEPAGARYRPPQTIRIRGPLEVPALERSINEVIRRHEALRTSFPIVNDEPVQRIAPSLTVKLDTIDLRRHAEPKRTSELQHIVEEEAQRSFDLVNGPLMRTKLLQTADDEYTLLLSIYHLVSDGWSLGVFFREVESLYNSTVRGRILHLPDLPIQYADFAVWQRRYLTGETMDAQLTYWREQLGPEVPVLELPTDRPRPPVQTYAGASCHTDLPAHLTKELRVLGEREGATLFMVLLAAFKVLLHRHSGQDQIVVGTPIANRNYKEIEGLIGFFVNTLVLCTDLSGNPDFRALLRRVRDTALGAYAHQDLPFERLVEALRPERDLSRVPLFQVFFNMLNYDDRQFRLDGLTTEMIELPKKEARFDLSLYVREHDEQIGLTLVFNTDLFDERRAVEMLAQLELLLGRIAGKPEERILDLPLATNRARSILPDPTVALCDKTYETVLEGFNRSAQQFPENVAATDSCQTVSYAELCSCSNRIANYLHSRGIRPHDVVALCGDRSVALVAAILGILKSGAAFAVLDPACPAQWLAAELHSAEPQSWITVTETGVRLRDISGAMPIVLCRLEIPRRLSDLAEVLRDYSAECPAIAVGPEDPAYITFTSGSTGARPAAILGTHKPLAHFLQWYCRTFDLSPCDRFSMLSGLSHDPLLRDIFTPLQLGATLCIPEQENLQNPSHLAGWMNEMGITAAHLTPAMADVLTTQTGDGRTRHVPSLRYVFFGGDVLTARHVVKMQDVAPGAVCVNFYGTTETPQAVGYHIVSDRKQAAPDGETVPSTCILPIGRGIDDVQLLILNRAGRPAGIGESGEICVRTSYLSKGYVNNDALTARKFIRNPFTADPKDLVYKTGDLGRFDPDGNVHFHGRLDRQCKIRGFRVEPAEIEAVLTGHDAVRDAVVITIDDDRAGKRLIAYVVCRESVPSLHLRGYLRALLPHYMIPAQFIKLEAMPLTPNGKIDYRQLQHMSRSEDDEHAFLSPSTVMEHRIAGIWKQVLGVERVGVRDNFFDLGGHSLMAIKAVSQIERAIGVRVPLREFFGQTLGQFSASCERAMGSKAGAYAD